MSRSTTRLVFCGRLDAASFADFARHRALRLDLDLNLMELSKVHASLTVEGEGELVDAFEMACSLGPHDCVITDVVRQDQA